MLEVGSIRLENIECRIIDNREEFSTPLFVWIGDNECRLDSLITAYPASSPTRPPVATTLVDTDLTSRRHDTDNWGEQMAKRFAQRIKRPVLLSFQPPSSNIPETELYSLLRRLEAEILKKLLVKN